jgi:DNA-directed RNA polymerase subunit RPC12/RpoP
VSCPKCGKLVTLRLDPESPKRYDSPWVCPWCSHHNVTMTDGRVIAVQAALAR